MPNNLNIQITSRKRSGNTLNTLKEMAEQKARELEKTELNTKKALVENLTKLLDRLGIKLPDKEEDTM